MHVYPPIRCAARQQLTKARIRRRLKAQSLVFCLCAITNRDRGDDRRGQQAMHHDVRNNASYFSTPDDLLDVLMSREIDRVAGRADCTYDVGIAIRIQCFAQPADVDVNSPLLDIDIMAPHCIEQLLA